MLVELKTSVRLIIGLGNPGAEYASTRHNAGYWFVEALAKARSVVFRQEAKYKAEVARVEDSGQEYWLFKPLTYMNLSGQAVSAFARFYKIETSELLVAHDELDLPPGTARLKQGGGHGGHNGLRDIAEKQGADYWRLRFGIGHPGHKALVHDYVLGKPSVDDRIEIERAMDRAQLVLPDMLAGHWERAMNQLHAYSTPSREK